MVKVDPKLYRKYVITSKQGGPMLYVKLTKDFYGMLFIAMIFYKNLRRYLEVIGFRVNPYYPCVANMTISSYQMTVC